MKVKSINYQRTYNTGNYTSLRLGTEIELEGNDLTEEAFAHAKEIVEAEYKASFPPTEVLPFTYQPPQEPLPEIQVQEEPVLTLEQQIASSPDIKTLEAYRLIVKSSPDLQEIYNDTLAKLTK